MPLTLQPPNHRFTAVPYYSTMIEVDKERTLDGFARYTDILSHGKDIPDVDMVVGYGPKVVNLVSSYRSLDELGGECCRDYHNH
jgi:hypothetical protein